MNQLGVFAFVAIFGLCYGGVFDYHLLKESKKLPAFGVKLNEVSITGFSSGAMHTIQYHYAHSSRIKKVGIFEGFPYLYAQDLKNISFVTNHSSSTMNDDLYMQKTTKYSNEGLIDPVSNIADSTVYVFHGYNDWVVNVEGGKSIVKIYEHFKATIAPNTNVAKIPANHGFPTKNSGGPCELFNAKDWGTNNCSYNGAYEVYRGMYGSDIQEPPGGSVGTVDLKNGVFYQFDQAEFLPAVNPEKAGMDKYGYVYVPSGCKEKPSDCKASIVVHPCGATRMEMGDTYARTTGMLEVAELNNIIQVYPQVLNSAQAVNIHGCWDFYGYTGPDFPYKTGKQITVTNKILDRILGLA